MDERRAGPSEVQEYEELLTIGRGLFLMKIKLQ